jgi:hypothetical protein
MLVWIYATSHESPGASIVRLWAHHRGDSGGRNLGLRDGRFCGKRASFPPSFARGLASALACCVCTDVGLGTSLRCSAGRCCCPRWACPAASLRAEQPAA